MLGEHINVVMPVLPRVCGLDMLGLRIQALSRFQPLSPPAPEPSLGMRGSMCESRSPDPATFKSEAASRICQVMDWHAESGCFDHLKKSSWLTGS